MVVAYVEQSDLPKATLWKHSCEAVHLKSKETYGQHYPYAADRECSCETVLANVEPCDLPKATIGKPSREAVA
eukprot:1766271-Amphidinium_carterae.1